MIIPTSGTITPENSVFENLNIIKNIHAQTNPNLRVSGEHSQFANTFGGLNVIEVVVDDPDLASTIATWGEPEVTINNQKLRMVQASDGKWYGYFADRYSAQQADSLVGLAGHGLDFGEFCDNDSLIADIDLSATAGFTIPRDISSASNGNDSLGSCTSDISSSGPVVNNVVREAPSVNQQIGSAGQIGIDVDAWPIVQLYDITPTGNVIVKYVKGGVDQTSTLLFDTVDVYSKLDLDEDKYCKGQQVLLTITDAQLNVDPTDEDSWTFSTIHGNYGTYYQLFNEDGNVEADGTSGAVDIGSNLQYFQFEDNGVFKLHRDTQATGTIVVNLQDNDLVVLVPESGNPNEYGTESIGAEHFPVTFTETGPNTATFVNYDENGISNLIMTDDAEYGSSATVDYNDAPSTVLTWFGFSPQAYDHTVTTDNATPIAIEVADDDSDLEGNYIYITFPTSPQHGSVVVDSQYQITYASDPDFIGTDSFVHMLDDHCHGSETGTIVVTVTESFATASIDGISVSTDKSSYLHGDSVSITWSIPSDTLGDESVLSIYDADSNLVHNLYTGTGLGYLSPASDYFEGETYTARVEHGQYYGEIAFVIEEEEEPPDDSTQDDTTSDSDTTSSSDTQDSSSTDSDSQQSSTTQDDTSSSSQTSSETQGDTTTHETQPSTVTQDNSETETSPAVETQVEATVQEKETVTTSEQTTSIVDPKQEDSTAPVSTKIDTVFRTTHLEGFPDPEKSPQYYIDRYNDEGSYREWFDKNFPDSTIEDVVGYKSSGYSNYPDPEKPPQYYIDRYNNEESYREWFASKFPDKTIYEVIGISEVIVETAADLEPITTDTVSFMDEEGEIIDEPEVNQKVEITTTITNEGDDEQEFVFLIQIKDSDGVVVSVSFVTGTLSENTSLEPSLTWNPDNPGEYTTELFVWDDLDDPNPLSSAINTSVTVK